MLPLLEQRNKEYGKYLEQKTARHIADQPGAGAAGGIGAALMSMPHHRQESGIELLLRLSHFDSLLDGASLVVTGEGHIDRQSLQGKAPYHVALHANRHGVPCLALCGGADSELVSNPSPWHTILPVAPADADTTQMMRADMARINIRRAVGQIPACLLPALNHL